jgi:deoxycytidine triphosphate deaminase/cell division protein FtsL
MGFSEEEYKKLLALPGNELLNKTEAERYNLFSETDPFPGISASLLNSKDMIQYILTVGMIEKFDPKDLVGATYICKFSGEYIYWDADRIKHRDKLTGDKALTIYPDSIVYLGIEPLFRIPEYLVLRFNLRVKNAYKGLLLGTGPIVDPGFTGRLFIPLHNLTSNEYRIKRNAPLIDVEFTKISNNKKWELDLDDERRVTAENLDFDSVRYVPKEKYDINRDIDKYIEESLTAEPLFTIANIETPFVNSSLEEEINKMKKMQTGIRRNMKGLQRFEAFFAFTVGTVIIAAATLIISVYLYFHNAKEIPDIQQKTIKQQEIIDQQQNDFDEFKSKTQKIINEMGARIHILEGREP